MTFPGGLQGCKFANPDAQYTRVSHNFLEKKRQPHDNFFKALLCNILLQQHSADEHLVTKTENNIGSHF